MTEPDIRDMRPRFSRLTRCLAAIFLLTGVGAGFAGLNSGGQTTPGAAGNGLILLLLGIAYAVVGAGVWMEYVWAWWSGLVLASIVVVVDAILGIFDGGFAVWALLLMLFLASGIDGWRHSLDG